MRQVRRFFITTLGCRLNQAESEEVAEELIGEGWERTSGSERAVLMIVNTCVVTGKAEHEARKLVRGLRRKTPRAFLVVMGCWVNKIKNEKSRQGGGQVKIKNWDERVEGLADLVVTNEEKRNLLKILKHKFHLNRGVKRGLGKENYSSQYQLAGRGLVWIQSGCSQGCSYCIVPYTRSKLVNRPAKKIVNMIKKHRQMGIKEVILTGVNLSCWKDHSMRLCDLLRDILKRTSVERIRFGSINFDCFDDDFISLLKNPRICGHVHLPIQSGSDKTLKKMKRPYKMADIKKVVRELRKIKEMSVTTDVMVGFPGETEKEFEESLRNIKEMGFDKLHVFAYSKRPGTLATKMMGKPGWEEIDKKAKRLRSQRMRALGRKMRIAFMESQAGKVLPVLFGEPPKGRWWGLTDNFLPVEVVSKEDIQGKIKKVKIEGRKGMILKGALL